MRRLRQHRHPFHPRAGLAPLELTLALPMLMFVLCLMINFGVIGTWKIRTQVAARYAGWGTVAERTGQHNPGPRNWPSSALWEEAGGSDLPEVDSLWNANVDLLAPSVRGEQLTSPRSEFAINVPGRLEMDSQVQRGHARIERPIPLLRNVTPSGQFRFNLEHDLFDNRWQFFTLGFPSNESIRAVRWYDIAHSDLSQLDPALDDLWDRVQEIAAILQSNPEKCRLYPLDRDEEWRRYYGRYRDFYPRIGGCSLDVDHVTDDIVEPLLRRINNLPCTVGGAFATMYRNWICGLEACGYADAEIQPLRDKYNGLMGLGCGIGPLPQRCICRTLSCPCPPSPIVENCP